MVREGAQGESQSLICGEPQPILHKDGTSTMLGQVFSFTSLTRALLFFWDGVVACTPHPECITFFAHV